MSGLIYTMDQQPTLAEYSKWFYGLLGPMNDNCPGDMVLMSIGRYVTRKPKSKEEFELISELLEWVPKALLKYRKLWANNSITDDELREYKANIYRIKNKLYFY